MQCGQMGGQLIQWPAIGRAIDRAGDVPRGQILADFSPKCMGCGMKCSGCQVITKKVYGLQNNVVNILKIVFNVFALTRKFRN